ncbi:uncharacterized protein RHO25_001697 [Cercospora beticola]|uniref:Uncharacterized protein n=1 Tax=Cercospora beticola TaxID=122368 RepID=A0ABZ0NC58_CERBT|nr:hypothetical protein RHO25_001697 [Cercospora beticola]CAK1354515.1 unnamed protein product [Cercospora beticola]
MAPRHTAKCLLFLQKLDASYRRAKTKTLLGQCGDNHNTIPNYFHGCGYEEGPAFTARVTSVKNAEAEGRTSHNPANNPKTMAPRHLEKCFQLAEELDAAYLRAKTNRLLGQYGGDTVLNHFHGYGCADGAEVRGHVASVKNAEAEVRQHFDRGYLVSVADVYGAVSNKLDPKAKKELAMPGRQHAF